ncbi:glutamate--tRNA ligase [Kribbella sp. NPDC004875]|uniref:glutamate--tRNA ligase n=1 Tax=Kribbella sp. NPDC004875 TaxID=3364107 RepID=UPI00367A9D80
MTDRADKEVLGDLEPHQVRVRFPPSPTGLLTVGNIRSALFNWAFARHYGGKLVLRIEDTDTARNTEEGYRYTLESLQWLGLTWDEGPDNGGDYGPYKQSERMDIYADVVAKLLAAGKAYHCYCSQEELDQRREAARSAGQHSGYDGHCRTITPEQIQAYVDEGRRPVVRLRMPDRPIVFDDLVRGEITFLPENLGDYVLVRANGYPLYPLVNPVDDALMEITHVLRGEDLLSSTPRQIALYEALAEIGIGGGRIPKFGHLPFVMGTEGNKKLSKRDPGAGLGEYMERGFLPEGLLNYLALLGWSIAEDRDVFTMAEMVAAFDIRKVNANSARFDPKKCEAINAAHMRMLPPEEFAQRMIPFLAEAGLLPAQPSDEQLAVLRGVVPLVQERMNALGESVEMVGFLFVDDASFTIDPDAAAKVLTGDAGAVLDASAKALADVEWTTAAIEAALRAALIDGLGLKPKNAFGPVRVAISGRRISPPLFESLELLGRETSLRRLEQARRTTS